MAPKLFVSKQVIAIRVTRSHRGQDRSSIQKITVDNPEVVSKETLTAISVVRMPEIADAWNIKQECIFSP